MGMRMKAVLAVLVCLLFASSILLAVASAQTAIPTLSVPEFSAKLVPHPFDVQTIYIIDPSTGEKTVNNGYHDITASIDISIKNQNYDTYQVYYNIQAKGHLHGGWIPLYKFYNGTENIGTVIAQSSGLFTLISIPHDVEMPPDHTPDTDVDIQVEAILSHVMTIEVPISPFFPSYLMDTRTIVVIDATSGWSDAQTINLLELNPSASPGNIQEDLTPITIIAGLAAAIVIVALLAYGAKHKGWK
jgi:hypothetical protein